MTEYRVPGSPSRYNSIKDLRKGTTKLRTDIREECYTVQDALDGGTVFLRPQRDEGGAYENMEIGLAPALLAKFNGGEGMFNSILTKAISHSQQWTWQDFEISHVCYLAATMAALVRERQRFEAISLGTLLRNVKPTNSDLLSGRIRVPDHFEGATYISDLSQCIPRADANLSRRISVDLTDFNHIHLAATANPIVDAYISKPRFSRFC